MATTIGWQQFQAAVPRLDGELRVAGLEGTVEVYRDRLGIPHIRAGSLHDAFFAQGFVHGQDRLWQMEYDRRRAAGRFAECGGPAALETDRFMRRLRLVEGARADYDASNAETRAMLDAYASGVNAFATTGPLPVEFQLLGMTPERWEPWHCGAVFKVRHVLMGLWSTKLWRARLVAALGPELAARVGARGNEDGVLIVPPGVEYQSFVADLDELQPGLEALAETPELGGSNNWAVHGTRTASGKPLVAGDPHRFLDVPNVYYQCHLACPEFDVAGFNFGGVPGFPHFAHNARVAWCITHASADYQDLYLERFRPADSGYEYEYQGQWRPATTTRETIAVRDSTPDAIEVVATHHGPVVVGDPARGRAMALRYSALDTPNLGLQCLLPMLRASSVEQLDEAMRDWVDPCNNLTMADVHGTIGYLHRGRVPVRSRANGWLPVPGWTGEHEWQGDVPFEELPRSRNPRTGFVATANNRIVGPEYPHFLSNDYAPPHRALRLVERLSALDGATIDDMASVHADRVSLPSRRFLEVLARVEPRDTRSAAARERLLGWDGVMDKQLVAPALYHVTRDQLTRLVTRRGRLAGLQANPFRGEPNVLSVETRLWAAVLNQMAEDDTALLEDGDRWTDLLAEALQNATTWLAGELGENMDEWRWQRLHLTRPVHPLAGVFAEQAALLNPPSVSLGGDADTVQAAGAFPGQSTAINGTSVARYAFDLGDWDNSQWVVPLGASGHPGSPHFADQAQDWSEVRMNPMRYSWERVAAEAETTQRLVP
jgi:penicillin amidase